MDVELSAPRRGVPLGHVLTQDLDRCRPLHEHRAEIADERGEYVLAPEGVGGADGACLLAERSEETADYFGLPVEIDQPLLEGSREAHPVVQLEELFPGEPMRSLPTGRAYFRRRHAALRRPWP